MSKKFSKLFIGGLLLTIFLGGCTKTNSARQIENSSNSSKNLSSSKINSAASKNLVKNDGFLGDKGDAVESQDGKILISESDVNDGNLHAFNYSSKSGKNIYFFVVKAPDGTYRAAANACEVCYGSKKGFKQIGDQIQCVNCRTTYSKSQIAKDKGGCNPGPIDKNVAISNGELVINAQDVEAVSYLF